MEDYLVKIGMSNALSAFSGHRFHVEQGVNIDQQMQSGSFKFVDLVPYLRPSQSLVSPLVELFRLVKDYVGENLNPEFRTTVIFDDTSSLEWLGHPTLDSTRFIRALCSFCRKVCHP
jgi:hypothetical protein